MQEPSYGEKNAKGLTEEGTHLRNIQLIKLFDFIVDWVATDGDREICNQFQDTWSVDRSCTPVIPLKGRRYISWFTLQEHSTLKIIGVQKCSLNICTMKGVCKLHFSPWNTGTVYLVVEYQHKNHNCGNNIKKIIYFMHLEGLSNEKYIWTLMNTISKDYINIGLNL